MIRGDRRVRPLKPGTLRRWFRWPRLLIWYGGLFTC
jgi:hypothetical protein